MLSIGIQCFHAVEALNFFSFKSFIEIVFCFVFQMVYFETTSEFYYKVESPVEVHMCEEKHCQQDFFCRSLYLSICLWGLESPTCMYLRSAVTP